MRPLIIYLALLFQSGWALADSPPAGSVRIVEVNYLGQGCPAGSAITNISHDGLAMTTLFDQYLVDGAGQSSSAQCNLNIKLAAPPGWTFGLFCVDVRGYASLDQGATANHKVKYSFGGASLEIGKMELSGIFDDDYQHLTQVPFGTINWAPCGQDETFNLNIATDISVRSTIPGARGLMTVDSVDGSVQHHYGIAWKRCPTPKIELESDVIDECSDIVFEYSGFPVTATAKGNWVTIAEVGSTKYQHTFRDIYLPQQSAGIAHLSTRGLDPQKQYEIRAYEDWEGTRSWEIKDAHRFRITPNGCVTPKLSTDRRVYRTGEIINFEFEGLLGPASNWVTIATPSTVTWKQEKFIWLPQTTSGSAAIDTTGLAPGDYELRIYEDWAGTKDYYIFDRVRIQLQ